MNDLEYRCDDEIDLRDIFRPLWKWKRFIAGMVVASTLIAVITLTSLYPREKTASITIRLNFSGIDKHMYPNGRLFEKGDIISPYILKQTLSKFKLRYPSFPESSLYALQGNITIESVVTDMMEKKIKNAEKKGEFLAYQPNRFIISGKVLAGNDISKEMAFTLLTEVVETFSENFKGRYGKEPVVAIALPQDFIDTYDYGEIHRVLVENTAILKAFLTNKINEVGYFRSMETGETFRGVAHEVAVLDDIDIRQVGEVIKNKMLTRRPNHKINIYEKIIEELTLKHEKTLHKSQIAHELLTQNTRNGLSDDARSKNDGRSIENSNMVVDTSLIDRLKKDSAQAYLLRITLESKVAASDASVDIAYYEKKIDTLKGKNGAIEDIALLEKQVMSHLRAISGEVAIYAERANALNREYLNEKIRGAVRIEKEPSMVFGHEKNIYMLTVLVFMVSLFLAVICVFVLEAFKKGKRDVKEGGEGQLNAA